MLYLDNGYLNIEHVLSQGATYNIIVGGRGTGKTFGALSYALDTGKSVIYMRRTQSQVDILRTPEFSPYNAINRARGESLRPFPVTKYHSAVYRSEIVDSGKAQPCGDVIGYICGLSTFANLRGFDMSDVELLIYDEFIPERHERPLKNEAEAFFNAYETINRNRELDGKAPLRVLFLANSNQLTAPILLYLNVARKLEKMQESGKVVSIDRERSLAIFNLNNSPISEEKRNTALYKLTSGTAFEEMSIRNAFVRNTGGKIVSRPLREYVPIFAVGELCIYSHKSNSSIYVSSHISGSPPHYKASGNDLERMRKSYSYMWRMYIAGIVEFEDYFCEVLFTQYFTANY